MYRLIVFPHIELGMNYKYTQHPPELGHVPPFQIATRTGVKDTNPPPPPTMKNGRYCINYNSHFAETNAVK